VTEKTAMKISDSVVSRDGRLKVTLIGFDPNRGTDLPPKCWATSFVSPCTTTAWEVGFLASVPWTSFNICGLYALTVPSSSGEVTALYTVGLYRVNPALYVIY